MIMMKFQPEVKFKRPARAFWPANFFNDQLNPATNGLSKQSFQPAIRNQPLVNISESRNHFTIELAAPGVEKDQFQINLDGDRLVVSTKKSKEDAAASQENYQKKEFDYQTFERSFRLGEMVDPQKISAEFNQGILILTLMKKEEAQKPEPRQIEIA